LNPWLPPCEICTGPLRKELRCIEDWGREVRNVRSVGVGGRIGGHDPPRFAGGLPGRYEHRLLPVCCPTTEPRPSGPQSESPACIIPAARAGGSVTCGVPNRGRPLVTAHARARPFGHGPSADQRVGRRRWPMPIGAPALPGQGTGSVGHGKADQGLGQSTLYQDTRPVKRAAAAATAQRETRLG
jgi:hypothetical protein